MSHGNDTPAQVRLTVKHVHTVGAVINITKHEYNLLDQLLTTCHLYCRKKVLPLSLV